MTYILFGYPIVFWLGLISFALVMLQIITGYYLTHGYPSIFKFHKINAAFLILFILVHALFAISLYL